MLLQYKYLLLIHPWSVKRNLTWSKLYWFWQSRPSRPRQSKFQIVPSTHICVVSYFFVYWDINLETFCREVSFYLIGRWEWCNKKGDEQGQKYEDGMYGLASQFFACMKDLLDGEDVLKPPYTTATYYTARRPL